MPHDSRRRIARPALLALLLAGAPTAARAQILQEMTPVAPGKPPIVTVFGEGDVKNVVSQPGTATSATGAIGLTFQGARFIVTGLVNVVARSDTLTTGLASSLLPPVAGNATSALIDIRRTHLSQYDTLCADPNATDKHCKVGFHLYLASSLMRWATDTDAAGKPTKVADVPIWATGTGLYYRFFDGTVGDSNRVALGTDWLIVTRHLRGDLSASQRDAQRDSLLQSRRTNFVGLSAGLSARYNAVNAGLTYYYMLGGMPGFARGQIVAAIAVRATITAGEYKGP